VTFDCADPDGLARFWAAALGYQLQDPPPGFATWPEFLTAQGVPEAQWNSASAIVDPAGQGARIFFQQVPEPKQTKNRVHLDVSASGGRGIEGTERRRRVDAEVERLVGLGATQQGPMERLGEHWVVMQDPEGNEFCVQ
jgi:hypothetical protein